MKAIILAGGTGSRLYPLTQMSSKQWNIEYHEQTRPERIGQDSNYALPAFEYRDYLKLVSVEARSRRGMK